jgi:hypothetical protein
MGQSLGPHMQQHRDLLPRPDFLYVRANIQKRLTEASFSPEPAFFIFLVVAVGQHILNKMCSASFFLVLRGARILCGYGLI